MNRTHLWLSWFKRWSCEKIALQAIVLRSPLSFVWNFLRRATVHPNSLVFVHTAKSNWFHFKTWATLENKTLKPCIGYTWPLIQCHVMWWWIINIKVEACNNLHVLLHINIIFSILKTPVNMVWQLTLNYGSSMEAIICGPVVPLLVDLRSITI